MSTVRALRSVAAADRPRVIPELLLGLAVFGCYVVVAALDERVPGRAERNGRAVYQLEKVLHLDVEPALNRWLAGRPVLATLANYEYATTYVIAAFGLLGWVYLRRPAEYRPARTTFVLINLIAITCFALYPVAPPRLLSDLGFVDTVRLGQTVGSWGSPMVAHANQVAAMPSLHLAWALWVSAVLARVSSGRLVQLISAVHVASTVFVIVATANHYLLDAAGGALVVWVGMRAASPPGGSARERGEPVPAADAFFLYVEAPAAPQHVAGLAVLDHSSGAFDRDRLVATVRAHLGELPRFRQRLSIGSRWRRPRWVEHAELDWDWHVPARDLTGPHGEPGGTAALHALAAEFAARPLPRDRPLWRFVVVTGVAPDTAAVILVVHHVIADGIGTVAQAMTMLEPVAPEDPLAAADRSRPPRPGALRRGLAVGVGLAQLATDGRPSSRLPTGNEPARVFSTVAFPLAKVRAVARTHGARVSDVLLSSLVAGLRTVLGDAAPTGPAQLRVAVPLMVREPGSSAEGNLTAAVMTDVPLGPLTAPRRLAEVVGRSQVLYTGTRALASTFVMRQVCGLLPAPAHAWFARTVYGGAFFQAIVSNMPGPQAQLGLAGAPLVEVYPVLPLAPGAPLAVGTLGWAGTLYVGICADPALVADARELAAGMAAAFEELGASDPGRPDGSAGIAQAAPGR